MHLKANTFFQMKWTLLTSSWKSTNQHLPTTLWKNAMNIYVVTRSQKAFDSVFRGHLCGLFKKKKNTFLMALDNS